MNKVIHAANTNTNTIMFSGVFFFFGFSVCFFLFGFITHTFVDRNDYAQYTNIHFPIDRSNERMCGSYILSELHIHDCRFHLINCFPFTSFGSQTYAEKHLYARESVKKCYGRREECNVI